jgi:hypothetical protein
MIQMYITTVIVSYFNMFSITWFVIITDDGSVIAETCRKDGNCTVVYTMFAYVGFVNKIHTLIARNEQH